MYDSVARSLCRGSFVSSGLFDSTSDRSDIFPVLLPHLRLCCRSRSSSSAVLCAIALLATILSNVDIPPSAKQTAAHSLSGAKLFGKALYFSLPSSPRNSVRHPQAFSAS
ncbi:hypothetical protein GY45DRAFT_1372017 [Cubamyces sp. BRFM 1775]|nr:hypothetical protein GY45DRAFT_1372017 [Cubamyces sp. BRFM 1775]